MSIPLPKADNFLQKIGLELALWDGVYEAKVGSWLRWHDANGVLLPTGAETAQAAQEQAEQERERAERAEQLRLRPSYVQNGWQRSYEP